MRREDNESPESRGVDTNQRSGKVVVYFLAVFAFCALLAVLGSWKPAPHFEDAAFLKSATNIVFTQRGFESGDQKLSITDSNEVARFLASVRLLRKEPCICAHDLQATFLKRGGEVIVSFCDHCFTVYDETNPTDYERARLYKMPKEFYAEFFRLARGQTSGKWALTEPSVR